MGSAQYTLGRFGPDTDLRRWGLKLAESVTFGGLASLALEVQGPSRLVCRAPTTGLAGPVDVRVTTPGGISPMTNGDRYLYTP